MDNGVSFAQKIYERIRFTGFTGEEGGTAA